MKGLVERNSLRIPYSVDRGGVKVIRGSGYQGLGIRIFGYPDYHNVPDSPISEYPFPDIPFPGYPDPLTGKDGGEFAAKIRTKIQISKSQIQTMYALQAFIIIW